MLGKLALALLLLIATASAEKYDVGNYSISFDINKQHQINQSDGGVILKTFDGWTFIFPPNARNFPNELQYAGDMHNNTNGTYSIFVGDGTYFTVLRHDLVLKSTLDLTNLSDFLKSLKIEKLKA